MAEQQEHINKKLASLLTTITIGPIINHRAANHLIGNQENLEPCFHIFTRRKNVAVDAEFPDPPQELQVPKFQEQITNFADYLEPPDLQYPFIEPLKPLQEPPAYEN